jgi:hypothetical protein
MPAFWLALILQLVFSRDLHWFPTAGEYNPGIGLRSPDTPHHRHSADRWSLEVGLAPSDQFVPASGASGLRRGIVSRGGGDTDGAGPRFSRPPKNALADDSLTRFY